MDRIIAAIDGSLTCSAVCIGTGEDVLFMEKFQTSADDPIPRRLVQIYNYFHNLFRTWNVTEVVFESKFFDPKKDPQGALNLGRVDGAIMMAAEALGIPCKWYAPGTIKKVATGKGNASKEDVQTAMRSRFKDHPVVAAATPDYVQNPATGRMRKNKVDDLWDALALWYTHTLI